MRCLLRFIELQNFLSRMRQKKNNENEKKKINEFETLECAPLVHKFSDIFFL